MNERRKQIFDLLCQRGELTIDELSRQLDVSPSSVRRVLGELNDWRFIERTHGGLTLSEVIRYTPLPIYKHPVDPEEARVIAFQAAQMVGRGDVVGLSGGRICTELALHLRMHEGIAVVTNAVNVAAELVALPGIQVMLTGGQLDPQSFELIGQVSLNSLAGIRVHRYFMGTDGITVEHGMTNRNEAEALVAREFIHHADETVVLADSSKFVRSNLAQVVPISEVRTIITTDRTPAELLAQFEAAGIKVVAIHCPRCKDGKEPGGKEAAR